MDNKETEEDLKDKLEKESNQFRLENQLWLATNSLIRWRPSAKKCITTDDFYSNTDDHNKAKEMQLIHQYTNYDKNKQAEEIEMALERMTLCAYDDLSTASNVILQSLPPPCDYKSTRHCSLDDDSIKQFLTNIDKTEVNEEENKKDDYSINTINDFNHMNYVKSLFNRPTRGFYTTELRDDFRSPLFGELQMIMSEIVEVKSEKYGGHLQKPLSGMMKYLVECRTHLLLKHLMGKPFKVVEFVAGRGDQGERRRGKLSKMTREIRARMRRKAEEKRIMLDYSDDSDV
jgi:hypothetical protein